MFVRVPEQLSAYGTGAEVEGATAGEALEALFRVHPRLRERVLDAKGRVHPHLLLFVAGSRATLATPVRESDEIEIFLAAEGG